jgi:hypothetical protein
MNEASREEVKVKLLAAPISQASPQHMKILLQILRHP